MVATPKSLYPDSSPHTSALLVRTVEQVISEAGEDVPWVIENLLARGAVTEFSGLAKKGGKTTFWCHAIAAGAREEDHAGFATETAKYLYLSEQGNNFAEALRDSGLERYPNHISIVQFKDVSAIGWEQLIKKAGAEAKRRNLDALIVDTFTVFARLKGSEENDSRAIAERMRVLNLVAQVYDIAVVLIRHAGKDGTPRGSSAFEGVADICVTIARPEGRHTPTVRKIAGVGRYGEWERNIQLTEAGYISLGTDDSVEFRKAVRFANRCYRTYRTTP
jgi:AAA domain